MAELAARYDDRQLEAITSFLTGLGAILDDQTEAIRTSAPTKPTSGQLSRSPRTTEQSLRLVGLRRAELDGRHSHVEPREQTLAHGWDRGGE